MLLWNVLVLAIILAIENSFLFDEVCIWITNRYCCSVWGCCGSTGINHLQKLQNKAERLVSSSSSDAPSRPHINELGWKTIDGLVNNEFKVMGCKSQHQLAPQYLRSIFIKNSNLCSRNLRNTEIDLKLPLRSRQLVLGSRLTACHWWRQEGHTVLNALARTKVLSEAPSKELGETEVTSSKKINKSANGQKSFSSRGAKFWNSLSVRSKQATTLHAFKKSLVPLWIFCFKLFLAFLHFIVVL